MCSLLAHRRVAELLVEKTGVQQLLALPRCDALRFLALLLSCSAPWVKGWDEGGVKGVMHTQMQALCVMHTQMQALCVESCATYSCWAAVVWLHAMQ